jgi:hypothetical protein
MREIHGDEVMQFNSLWDYDLELRRSKTLDHLFT